MAEKAGMEKARSKDVNSEPPYLMYTTYSTSTVFSAEVQRGESRLVGCRGCAPAAAPGAINELLGAVQASVG